MPKHEIVTGIDIGSSRIRCVIAEVAPDLTVEVLGYGSALSQGIKMGCIVDIEKAAAAIESAVAEAEKIAGFEVRCVYIGLGGRFLQSMGSHGEIAIGSMDRIISENDVRRVIDNARLMGVPPEREIIHILPRNFILDGTPGVKNPVGMSAMRLEVEALLVTALKTAVANATRSVEGAGLEIEEGGIVLGLLGTGLSCLTEELISLGSVVIDMGGDTTNIAIFKNGGLVSSSVIHVGGSTLTSDISQYLHLTLSDSEELKITRGSAAVEFMSEDEELTVASILSPNPVTFMRSELVDAIEARLTEVFEKARREIDAVINKGMPLGAVILTGGCAEIEGICPFAETILGLPVKQGKPVNPENMPEGVSDSSYAPALGLVIHGSRKRSRSIERPPSSSKIGDIFQKIIQWLHEVF